MFILFYGQIREVIWNYSYNHNACKTYGVRCASCGGGVRRAACALSKLSDRQRFMVGGGKPAYLPAAFLDYDYMSRRPLQKSCATTLSHVYSNATERGPQSSLTWRNLELIVNYALIVRFILVFERIFPHVAVERSRRVCRLITRLPTNYTKQHVRYTEAKE